MYRIRVVLVLLSAVVFCNISVAQDDRPKLDTAKSDSSLENAQVFFFYLSQREIKEELELAGRQLDLIEERIAEIQKGMEEYRLVIRDLRNAPDRDSKTMALRTSQLEKMSSQLELIRAELLPHQVKRIRQIAFQYETIKTKGVDSSKLLLAPKLIEDLQISDEQKNSISDAYGNRDKLIQAEYEKYAKRFRAIQQNTYEEILNSLSVEQKSEVEDVMGPPSPAFLSPSTFRGEIEKN